MTEPILPTTEGAEHVGHAKPKPQKNYQQLFAEEKKKVKKKTNHIFFDVMWEKKKKEQTESC